MDFNVKLFEAVHNQSCLVSQREEELRVAEYKLASLIELKEWHNEYKSKKLSKSFWVWLQDTGKDVDVFKAEMF